MKVADRLRMIRKLAPKGPSPFGQIYAAKADTQRRYQRVTLWTIFESEEGTHLVRPHVFVKDEGRTPQEWHAWFAEHVDKIQRDSVLPGINDRTGMTYFIFKRLGWIGHAGKFANTAAVGRKWRPSKQKGKSREQDHIRRGH